MESPIDDLFDELDDLPQSKAVAFMDRLNDEQKAELQQMAERYRRDPQWFKSRGWGPIADKVRKRWGVEFHCGTLETAIRKFADKPPEPEDGSL